MPLAQGVSLSEGTPAVDLGQTPGRVLVLSAADTELASLAAAAERLDMPRDELRLANLTQLGHPMSVDAQLERLAPRLRLAVIRVLGGRSYWAHGCEAWSAAGRRHGFPVLFLPGDERPDAELAALSTLGEPEAGRLAGYLLAGGPENADAFLRATRAILGDAPWPEPARPLPRAGEWQRARRNAGAPVAAVCFYRALLQSGHLGVVESLCAALEREGLDPLPVFVASLKDEASTAVLRTLFGERPPAVAVNLTSFAVSALRGERVPTVLEESGAVVLQGILAAGSREAWDASPRGLGARDLAMNVALPEVDGRVFSRALAFKAQARFDARTEISVVAHEPDASGIRFTAALAGSWARLRNTPVAERRVAIVLANYPNRDGRLGNGVGLDTPAGTVNVLRAMRNAGYRVDDIPADGDALMRQLAEGPTNAGVAGRQIRETWPLERHETFLATLPEALRQAVTDRWGAPADDPMFSEGVFAIPVLRLGDGVAIGVQPARGYNIDPASSFHDPALVPPHNYLAFYGWLREGFAADAVIHMGKHGNLEWLPGKALGASDACWPQALLGPLPHLYPFIVNDPGEGSQAKRRTAGVVVDHLTPPLARAESHGAARDLEALVDEYFTATEGDPRRARLLAREIADLAKASGLLADAGLGSIDDPETVQKLDGWLCELKEMQIRDGLHVFGCSPEGRLRRDTLVALARLPRGLEPAEASLTRALSADLDLAFDPLGGDWGAPWDGARPAVLASIATGPWRSRGDTVERLEALAAALVEGETEPDAAWEATRAVLGDVRGRLAPALDRSGAAEIAGLLAGLDGRFVPPGPSGAPTRGRPDTLPTGRNFFSVDTRGVPTEAAWSLGRRSAELLLARHAQDHGEPLRALALTAWGTANMRTGGDDIAQALALIGVQPTWERASGRVTGFEILTPARLGRGRVDVTLRISGFFRDAFPEQIALFDRAVRAVALLDEDEEDNPIAARFREETDSLRRDGHSTDSARRMAGARVFGSRPGAYGAGLQALIDEGGWRSRADLAEGFLVWGGYSYGDGEEGVPARPALERRLAAVQAVVQNQDNREHDLLDSDDYYQFEGGLAASVEHLSGTAPASYHLDHSNPERPVPRTLAEEIARVVRGRAANPKWIAGVMRHGYKGAFEMAATVDYLFAFAATTNAVPGRHFDLLHDAYLGDAAVRGFIERHNPAALAEMEARFREAVRRGFWHPRRNDLHQRIAS
nr:cobaltochelatase subunit CobN [Aureimonas jatrophae]